MTADRESARRLAAALTLGVVVTVVTAMLGNWQTRRGDAKEALQTRRDAAESAPAVEVATGQDIATIATELPRRVRAVGTFVPNATVFVDNRVLNGIAGFHVVAPLQIGSDAYVLVDRGWIARDLRDPTAIPRVATPGGRVQIEGLAVERVPRMMELARRDPARLPGIWPNVSYEDFEQASGLRVARWVVQQTNDTGDGLQRKWPRPDFGVGTHRGYALQWYGLSALACGLTVFFGWRALRERWR